MQEHGGGTAGFPHKGQEAVEIARPERLLLGLHPAVFRIDVERTVDGTVPGGRTKLRERRKEVLLGDLPEGLFAEIAADRPELIGDGGVFGGEILVPRPGIEDAEGIASGVKIQRKLRDLGGVDIGEINGDDPAHRGGQLVHQPAGLAEVFIFGVLADLGKLHRGAAARPEQFIEHGADEHLERCGGAEPAAPRNGGGKVGIQPAAL